jgi:hypothetical protein
MFCNALNRHAALTGYDDKLHPRKSIDYGITLRLVVQMLGLPQPGTNSASISAFPKTCMPKRCGEFLAKTDKQRRPI